MSNNIKDFVEQVDKDLFEEATIDRFQYALAKALVRKSHSKISIEDAHKLAHRNYIRKILPDIAYWCKAFDQDPKQTIGLLVR